jgi:ribose transport system permease protein
MGVIATFRSGAPKLAITTKAGGATEPPGLDPGSGPERPRVARGVARVVSQRFGLVIAWLVVIAAFGATHPSTFLSVANLSTILGSQSVIAVLTLGLIVPMIAGDFDMSIASVLTLSSMLVAVLNVNDHWPIVAAIVVSLAAGLAVGLINGAITTLVGINPFIVTLGTGTVCQGIVLLISNTNTISGVSPGLVNAVIADKFLSVPLSFYYALALCALLWYFFEYTRSGRLTLFVGRGRDVARLSGIRVQKVRFLALGASGLIAAFAGILYTGTSGAADPTSGTQLMLPAFAGAFLGATVVQPGRFNAWGSLVAIYFLATGITGLQMIGAQSYVQDLFYGGALVIAVALSHIVSRRRFAGEAAV